MLYAESIQKVEIKVQAYNQGLCLQSLGELFNDTDTEQKIYYCYIHETFFILLGDLENCSRVIISKKLYAFNL